MDGGAGQERWDRHALTDYDLRRSGEINEHGERALSALGEASQCVLPTRPRRRRSRLSQSLPR